MNKIYLTLAWLLFLLSNANDVKAQLSIKLAGKKYKIHEFDNTNVLPDLYVNRIDSECLKFHVVEPIASSPYQLEVRCSYFRYLIKPYIITVLRADKDSLWWEEYTVYKDHERMAGATKYVEIDQHHIMSIFFKHKSIDRSSYSIIDSLIHLGCLLNQI